MLLVILSFIPLIVNCVIQRVQRNTRPSTEILIDRSRRPDGFTGNQERGGTEKNLQGVGGGIPDQAGSET